MIGLSVLSIVVLLVFLLSLRVAPLTAVLFVGAIPVISATMATALLVSLTFFLDPLPAIAAIVSAVAIAIFSGDIPVPCCASPARPPRRPRSTTPTR